VAAFRVLPYLARRRLSFIREVQDLLDASEEDLKGLLDEPDKIHAAETMQ